MRRRDKELAITAYNAMEGMSGLPTATNWRKNKARLWAWCAMRDAS